MLASFFQEEGTKSEIRARAGLENYCHRHPVNHREGDSGLQHGTALSNLLHQAEASGQLRRTSKPPHYKGMYSSVYNL